MNDVSKIAKAFHFAAEKHSDQRRKGTRAEPYVNHVAEVAALLAEHTGGRDTDLIVAGLLHDTVEDVDVTYEEIEKEFGANVAHLVSEVTDDKSLPKAERKRLQIEHAAHASPRAKMLKIADKTANLRTLLESAPPDWTETRITEYFEWSKKVVDNCRGVNTGLEAGFDKLYRLKMG
jgi:(p)ppGpp synthase/HD superfamily hydrolase